MKREALANEVTVLLCASARLEQLTHSASEEVRELVKVMQTAAQNIQRQLVRLG